MRPLAKTGVAILLTLVIAYLLATIALSLVTFMGYSGILIAPSVIGFIAEYTTFSTIFTALPVLFLVVLAVSGLARHADMRSEEVPAE